MKCKYLLLLSAFAVVSCVKPKIDFTQVNDEMVTSNAETALGVTIDPNQTWSGIMHGSITVTADADLDDIVKVQILTESPFGNENATVLNSYECRNGDKVNLSYEAPEDLTELVAACVNSRGVYYVKVFEVGDQSVSFKASSQARTRADETHYPGEGAIILGSPIQSYNAQRAEASLNSEYGNVMVKDDGGKARYYDVWADGSWKNDLLWSVQSVTDEDWKVENGCVYRPVKNNDVDLATVKSICNTYLQKTGGTHQTYGKRNNWETIAQGNAYFNMNNNYVVSDGNPITIIPIQMNSTEGGSNSIYYYYYNPAVTAGMSSEAEANYIKSLPKYKAVKGFSSSAFNRNKEYLLPYFGDHSPGAGAAAVSNVIPRGYKIGFLNRKQIGDYTNCKSGCTYGDGRLNVEVNHLFGHFYSAMDKSMKQTIALSADGKSTQDKEGLTENGMMWNSPRIGVFSANNRTYMCFEDGADCNFCDMIIEINHGTEIIEETVTPEPEAAAYTMCFEDRPEAADYDMNDVVLSAIRINSNTIQIALVACGAEDKVVLHNVTGAGDLDNQEIHGILHLTEDAPFANTEIGGQVRSAVSNFVTTSLTIEEYLRNIYIENLKTGKVIRMPEKGKSPYAIIVPLNFNYPKEGTNIKNAYPGFLTWAQDMNSKKDWYRIGEGTLIFPALFR